jgi:2-polyprenyl-6-methoxyphenol hydroxylase-like FAD-dependent oxidoreductase
VADLNPLEIALIERTAVVGAGVAGLATALLLSRNGLAVEVYERDPDGPADVLGAGAHSRPGAPQTRHPHVFLGLFRRLLADHLPDVYEDLLANGVAEVPLASPGATGDQVMLAARRSVVEWALRRAVDRDKIGYHAGTSVREIVASDGAVRGVRLDGGVEAADLVVDCCGARSRLAPDWTTTVSDVECGKVYNSRFYRLADGVEPPPTRYGTVTIVDGLGYGAALFGHDHGWFSVDVGRLPEDESLKDLRDAEAFERVLALFPAFEPWLSVSRPASDVVPMAGLRNVLRTLSDTAPSGYVPLGDSLCVTDPTFGRGAALALGQAVRLAGAVADGGSAREAVAGIESWLRPWYDDVVLQDTARTTLWRAAVAGEPLGPILMNLPPNPFMLLDAAPLDPILADAAGRYVSMLTTTMDTPELRDRVGRLMPVLMSQAPPPIPSHEEVVKALTDGAR